MSAMLSESVTERDLISQLQDAIEAIPNHEKLDYSEALERSPHLVETESDPMRFLNNANFNVSTAARAIVVYWKRRREIFGAKAFLPLVITGDGALSSDVVEFIKTGFVVHIPDGDQNCNIYVDHSRRLTGFSPETRIQSVFYLAQLISENKVANTTGFNFLIPVSVPEKLDAKGIENTTVILNTLPIKTKAWHLFNCLPKWEKPDRFRNFMQNFRELSAHLLRNFPAYFHDTQDHTEIVEIMQSHGISKNGLPCFLGGNWSYENYGEWLAQRSIVDRAKYAPKPQELTNDIGKNGVKRDDVDMCSVAALLSLRGCATSPRDTAIVTDIRSPSVDGKIRSKESAEIKSLRTLSASLISKKKQGPALFLDWYHEVDKAMEELPLKETEAYREALAKASREIWKEEVGIERFLRVEDYNPFFAAKRIARYWQLRKSSFGPNQFAMLTQTGESGLGRREVQMLATSFLNLLPEDTNGCPVLWCECDRLPIRNSMPDESRERCFFYMFSLLAQNEKAQSDGAVLLYKTEAKPFSRVNLRWLEQLTYALPLVFKASHLIASKDLSIEEQSRLKIAKEAFTHVGDSHSLYASLKAFCVKHSGIPMSLGGEWGYERFLQWQELRMRMEFKIPLGFSGRDKNEAYSFPAIRPHTLLPATEKAERNRRLNIIHCKRKRDRERLSMEIMKEQRGDLQRKQKVLRLENKRLEDLIQQANALTEQVKEAASPQLDKEATGDLHARTPVRDDNMNLVEPASRLSMTSSSSGKMVDLLSSSVSESAGSHRSIANPFPPASLLHHQGGRLGNPVSSHGARTRSLHSYEYVGTGTSSSPNLLVQQLQLRNPPEVANQMPHVFQQRPTGNTPSALNTSLVNPARSDTVLTLLLESLHRSNPPSLQNVPTWQHHTTTDREQGR